MYKNMLKTRIIIIYPLKKAVYLHLVMIEYDIIDNIQDLDEQWVKSHIKTLPRQRREKISAIKHLQGQREGIVAYELLQRLISECFGINELPDFEYNEHGKPSLAGLPDIHFNISHCKEAVVVAVGNEPVGVDIESRGRYKESLVSHVMNDDEQQQIASSKQKDQTFTELWTMKEAILKYTGEGITTDLKTVIPSHPEVTIALISTEKYACSIVTEKH